MRLLYFSDNSGNHNRRFLADLARSENEIWFLDLSHKHPPERWLPQGVRWVQPRRMCRRSSDPSVVEAFLPEFRALLKEIQPDVVHAGPVPSCGYLTTLAGFHPMLLMLWGSDLLRDADRNAEWMRATEIALRGADGFFCDCETVRHFAQRIAYLPDSQIVQFPWGIKAGQFSPVGPLPLAEHCFPDPGGVTFLCTRSWEPVYGIDVLLEAFRRAHERNGDLRLVLLGGGSEGNRIQDFISGHGLGKVVLMPGSIAAAEVPKWFRAAGVYVSCAKSDGTSVSLLEAMATGLPVVVTDNPSNREWVVEGENGWLAAEDSAAEFAEKLLRAASLRPEERRGIAEQNQRIVAERADWDKNFPRLLDMYEHLAGSAVRR